MNIRALSRLYPPGCFYCCQVSQTKASNMQLHYITNALTEECAQHAGKTADDSHPSAQFPPWRVVPTQLHVRSRPAAVALSISVPAAASTGYAAVVYLYVPTAGESVASGDNKIHTTRQKPLSRSCLTHFSSFPIDALPLVVTTAYILGE